MEQLKQNSHLDIQEVSDKTGIERTELRDIQLEMIRKIVKRDNPLWNDPTFGRTER